MARVIIIKVDKFDWSDGFGGLKGEAMVYKPGYGLAKSKSYVHPRHGFVHYNPSIGPIFRNPTSNYSPFGEGPNLDGRRSGPLLLSSLKDVWITYGENAHLQCEFSGVPKPKITWFKDGKEVGGSYRIWAHFDGKVAELTINCTSGTDAGWYECRAKNDLGTRQTNCRLFINVDKHRDTYRGYRTVYDFKFPFYVPAVAYLKKRVRHRRYTSPWNLIVPFRRYRY